MALNDYLDENVIAQSINRFCDMKFRTLKRVTGYHSDEELFGIAHKVDREESGSKIIYDIYFKWPEDFQFLYVEKNSAGLYGVKVGTVKEKDSAFDRALRKSGLSGINVLDIHLYGKNVQGLFIDIKERVTMKHFTDSKDRFIPLYVPGKEIMIPIPPTIF